jgi:hypothetical protein
MTDHMLRLPLRDGPGLEHAHFPPFGVSAASSARTGAGAQNGSIWRGLLRGPWMIWPMRMSLTGISAYALTRTVTLAVIREISLCNASGQLAAN